MAVEERIQCVKKRYPFNPEVSALVKFIYGILRGPFSAFRSTTRGSISSWLCADFRVRIPTLRSGMAPLITSATKSRQSLASVVSGMQRV